MSEKRKNTDLKWLIFLGLVIICNLFVVRLAFVHGRSMEPTLHENECVVVWQLIAHIEAGDIVVTDRKNVYSENLIKRVIALGGQHVFLRGNQVYVEGVPLEEPYLSGHLDIHYTELDLIVPEGMVFLLGDNRGNSRDSRDIGCVPLEEIKGKVFLLFPD